MQTLIPAPVANPAAALGHSAWLKNAARVAFLLLFIKGAAWVAMSWLAFRGFNGL